MNKSEFLSGAYTLSNREIGIEIGKLMPLDILAAAADVKRARCRGTTSLVFGTPSKVELLAVLYALERASEVGDG